MDNNNSDKEVGMTFPSQKSSSKITCCVYGCKSYANKCPTVRFHRIPKPGGSKISITNKMNIEEQVDRCFAWKKAIKLDKKFSSKARVCSLHFTKHDYFFPEYSTKASLKKTAVPSLNLPKTSLDELKIDVLNFRKKHAEDRKKRTEQRSFNKNTCTITYYNSSHEVQLPMEIDSNEVNSNKIGDESISVTPPEKNNDSPEILVLNEDKEVQVDDHETHTYYIKSEKDLNIMTGLPSFEMLQILENEVQKASLKAPITCYSSESSKLTTKDRIVMTFIKLKQNVSFELLAVLFKVCSPVNCKRIFFHMLDLLSVALEIAVYWPDREEIQGNIPLCFADYSKVRAVIDVVEINIENPNNLCCRVGSYSSYKGTTTVRFMTAISPGGKIIFISKAFMGRTSVKDIFKQSRFIELLEDGDDLMSDPGSLIDDACLRSEVRLIRPPFLKNKEQFSKEEALQNAKIAEARIHIEKSNQRIKVFEILSSRLPSYLVPRIEQIFGIICGIVNLSAPILKNDKFVI